MDCFYRCRFRLFQICFGWLFCFGLFVTTNAHASPLTLVVQSESANIDTLVICPLEFQPALTAWIAYRKQQGHSIEVLAPALTANATQAQIRNVAKNGSLKFLFLIGDMASTEKKKSVPTHYVPATVNVLFGSEPEIASDSPYADLDDDGLPDLALGRLPADSAEEVSEFLRRVINYENDLSENQHWRRNINFVAGVGGFGGVIDNVLESTTKQIITDLVPQHFQTSMTFASWRSPYCPDPRQFSQTTIGRFNEGCLFWIYIGHGHPTGLDQVHLPDEQSHSILDDDCVGDICCTAGNPIAMFLSCYSGAADHREDCLAETMLRQPCGPIAAICGTRVTMPYAMSLMSLEMIDEYFAGDTETMGQLIQLSKRRMVNANDQLAAAEQNEVNQIDHYRDMVRGVGKLLSPHRELLRAECQEHVTLIHLFGDPLLRLKRAASLELTIENEVVAGTELIVSGVAPHAGELCLELVYRRDRFLQRPPRRREFVSSDEAFLVYQQTYDQSQNLTCTGIHQTVPAGPFKIALTVPSEATGECVVRGMISSANEFALGSVPIRIKK